MAGFNSKEVLPVSGVEQENLDVQPNLNFFNLEE